MELNQETIPEHILMPLKEARLNWIAKGYPTNPSSIWHAAINEALDELNDHLQAVEEFERLFNYGDCDGQD
jgi:predicted DNA-binding protein